MTPDNLRHGQAVALSALLRGKTLPQSTLPKSLIRDMIEAGAARRESRGRGFVLAAASPELLANFIRLRWNISDLDAYTRYLSSDERSRAANVAVAGNSKALGTSVFRGLYYREVHGHPEGICGFVHCASLPNLRLDSERMLVIVENAEAFLHFERARSSLELWDPVILVFRHGWSEEVRQWLSQWEGLVGHFGDYDPAGIRIFLTEVLPVFPSARFLCPVDLDSLLANGSSGLFLQQEKDRAYVATHLTSEVKTPWESILRHRKGYEQEGLLHPLDSRRIPS